MSKGFDKRYKPRFPVARIKRIMQMDEEVGKVAQATPVLISKAVELFMQSLITESCNEVRQRGGKRMSAAHVKKCVQNTEQFDFLKDLVANIPDPTQETTTPTDGGPESPLKSPGGFDFGQHTPPQAGSGKHGRRRVTRGSSGAEASNSSANSRTNVPDTVPIVAQHSPSTANAESTAPDQQYAHASAPSRTTMMPPPVGRQPMAIKTENHFASADPTQSDGRILTAPLTPVTHGLVLPPPTNYTAGPPTLPSIGAALTGGSTSPYDPNSPYHPQHRQLPPLSLGGHPRPPFCLGQHPAHSYPHPVPHVPYDHYATSVAHSVSSPTQRSPGSAYPPHHHPYDGNPFSQHQPIASYTHHPTSPSTEATPASADRKKRKSPPPN